nr:uncharacterized protein LOC116767307 [Danaus plexippus plexippus]
MSQLNIDPVKLECVSRVVQQEIECQDFFTVLHQSNYGDQIITNLSATNCYSFIVRTPKSETWVLRSEAYIILVKNVTEFIDGIEKLSKDFTWNAAARFFIVIHQFENMQYLDLFKVLAKFNIYHVRVIISETMDKTLVYTYNPFENNRCGRVDKTIIKMSDCKGFSHNELNKSEIENLIRPCPIAVFARDNPPNVILKNKRNLFRQESRSVGDCTSSNLLEHLSRYPLGISIGGYLLLKKGSDCFDLIWGYCYCNLNVYTTVSSAEQWKKVYQEFGTTTWALIALSYCSVTIVSIIIYKLSMRKINKKYIALKIWGYLNNSADKELIKMRQLRIIIVTWIWFSFFIVNFYNTALYTLITTPDKNSIFVKPENLFSSPLKPCISFNIRFFFKFTFNATIFSVIGEQCEIDENALDTVAKNKDLFTIISEPTNYKRKYKYLDEYGRPKLERWLFGTGDFAFTILTNRGFVLLDKFQRYAWYHFESGLLQKHTENLNQPFTVFTEFKPFTLSDLRIPFIILFIGYIISFIICVIEINHLYS